MTVFGEYAQWIRFQPCATCGAFAPSHPHHVKTRGAGGHDEENLIPLCVECHSKVHTWGRITFSDRMGVDLDALRSAYWSRYQDCVGRALA